MNTGTLSSVELDQLPPAVYRRRWLTLGVLCFSLVIIVMDNTILNVAIPSLMRDLQASNSDIQWIIDAYVLVFAGLLLTTGTLSDRFGRKGALQSGIILFALGSVLAALSQTSTQLILTRAFMGIGGAMIMPATLSILTNVFRDRVERGRAIAIWAAFSGVGVAIGPILGGFLVERYSWHSVFWVNVPVGLLALVLGVYLVPTSCDPRHTKVDIPGAILSIIGQVSILYGIIEGPSLGWTHRWVLLAFVIAVVTVAVFIAWERHTDHPMIDVSVFKNRRFSAASGTVTLVFFALMGSMFLMTQYWQLVHGYSPFEAGIRLLPQAITAMIVSPMSARFVEKYGTTRVVATGLVIMAIGLGLISTVQPDSSYPQVISYLIVMAIGMGLTMAPATESVMGSLPREKAGIGSAINDTTRQIGGALGIAIIGSVVSSVWGGRIGELAASMGFDREMASMVADSLGTAHRFASQIGDGGAAFITTVNQIFVDAMASGMRLASIVVVAAAVVVWKFLPATSDD
ncbi:MAG: MFS transporter [Ilumatobacter coccineus]|uniref:MFS transporter n=1 Tax=Ilumatobacter coccineus TaxID=467094 RepID=A0A2G6KFE4_9ACTN|nr:MAG: MFS transporter [Ilumatobacter coccineus]